MGGSRQSWHSRAPSITQGLSRADFRMEFGRSECVPSRPCLLSDGGVSSGIFISRMTYGEGMGATPTPQKALGHEQRSGRGGFTNPYGKELCLQFLALTVEELQSLAKSIL